MLASSLTVTVFFMLYLLIGVFSGFRERLLSAFKRILPSLDMNRAVFTVTSLAIIFLWGGIMLAIGLTRLVWHAALA